ncbi:hypothetical protein pb186bvf_001456 [Paramecium bursaria]
MQNSIDESQTPWYFSKPKNNKKFDNEQSKKGRLPKYQFNISMVSIILIGKVYLQNSSLTRALEFKDAGIQILHIDYLILIVIFFFNLMHNHSDHEIVEEDSNQVYDTKASQRFKGLKYLWYITEFCFMERKEQQCPNGCGSPLPQSYSKRICVMKPRDSWVTRRLVNDRKELYPGMYALEVQET